MSLKRHIVPLFLSMFLALGVTFAASLPLAAQTVEDSAKPAVDQPQADVTPTAVPEFDYDAWEVFARRSEAALEDPTTSAADLETLREELVVQREALLVAQNTNSARIATLREQIAALGPAPAEGARTSGADRS